jgi:hypothetical protein
MTHPTMAGSRTTVARQPNKPKAGKPVRMQIIFPGELVAMVDEYATKMTAENPFGRPATRTDALKALVVDALKAKGVLK